MKFVAFLSVASAIVAFSGAGAQTPADGTVAVAATEKVRCKRETEIGSLAKVHKGCHTEAQWRQMAEANRTETRNQLQNGGSTGPGH